MSEFGIQWVSSRWLFALSLTILVIFVGCGSSEQKPNAITQPVASPASPVQTFQPSQPDVTRLPDTPRSLDNFPASNTPMPIGTTQITVPPANTSTALEIAQASSTSLPDSTLQILRHSLPDTQVIVDVPLLYQPDGFAIAPDKIPAGASVILLGRDESQTWYRVFWQDYFGWIPIKVTNFPPSKALEMRAPPPCAKARSFRRGLDSEWISSSEGQLAVVIDLYRSSFGVEFPRSMLQIQVNETPVKEKERTVSSKGEFLTRGAVIAVPIKKQDRVGFRLLTPSSEEVKLFATIFSVPDGCSFQEQ